MKQSLIEIANYQFSSEAYLFKGKLESEGIEVFLQNENTSRFFTLQYVIKNIFSSMV